MQQDNPVALTIAGSDSSGGAGLQADLKTFTVLNVYGMSVVTAITAQNTLGVQQVQVLPQDMVSQQIQSVVQDIRPGATKTGMLATAELIHTVAQSVKQHTIKPLVVDPVMIAKSGDQLIDARAISTLVTQLLPLATVITPNQHEVARLLGETSISRTIPQAEAAARELCARFGCGGCVVKAISDSQDAVDVFFDGAQMHLFRGTCIRDGGTHGSGCAFSAAITAWLAKGCAMVDAVRLAKQFIQQAISQAPKRGQGTRPVNPLAYDATKA